MQILFPFIRNYNKNLFQPNIVISLIARASANFSHVLLIVVFETESFEKGIIRTARAGARIFPVKLYINFIDTTAVLEDENWKKTQIMQIYYKLRISPSHWHMFVAKTRSSEGVLFEDVMNRRVNISDIK